MHRILQRQELDYQIFIINQVGTDPFNRAKLLNVGFVEALKHYDWECFVFHDVDLGKLLNVSIVIFSIDDFLGRLCNFFVLLHYKIITRLDSDIAFDIF